MTNIIHRCKRCNEVIIRYKKGESKPSRLVMGANIAIHMITCDPSRFNAMIDEEFHGVNKSQSDKLN